MGPIHGRVLLASSGAALAGPSILLSLRSQSEMKAIQDLVAKVDPERFQQAFSAGIEDVQTLIEVREVIQLSTSLRGRGLSTRHHAGMPIGGLCLGSVAEMVREP